MGKAYGMHEWEEERIPGSGRKAEGKRPLERTRRRWEDNIKIS
jgi:hypothetical protein